MVWTLCTVQSQILNKGGLKMKYWNEKTATLLDEPIEVAEPTEPTEDEKPTEPTENAEPTEDKEPTEKKATVKNKK